MIKDYAHFNHWNSPSINLFFLGYKMEKRYVNFILLLGTQWLKVQGACYLRTIILVNTEMEIFGLCIDSIIKNKIKINSTKINLMMTKRIKTLHFSTSTNVFATGKAHGDGPTKISLKQNDTHGDNVHANISFFFKTALGKSKS